MSRHPSTPAQPPLPVVLVGAGGMGRAWLGAIGAEDDVELVGVVDLDEGAARAALADAGLDGVAVGTDVVEVARRAGARAVIDVTVPQAHHPVTTAALLAGLPVLGEKPVAADLPEALSLVAATRVTGTRFAVSQSRRYNPQAFAFREQARVLGRLGVLTTEFFKAPRFGGFRDAMAQPLLVDMAIHQFDLARFLLDAEPVAVSCDTSNPVWSWYAGDAAATAVFEMTDGVRYVFTGSWCSPGRETSWNGSWRLSGEHGTALWSGDDPPELDRPDAGVDPATAPAVGDGIAGALAEFVQALATGEPTMGEVADNVLSLAMVEAAVESADRRTRVVLDDVLQRAHAEAVRREQHDGVRAELASWASVRDALTATPVG